eukprot:667807-Pleurochrysis_carterae.AAC.5
MKNERRNVKRIDLVSLKRRKWARTLHNASFAFGPLNSPHHILRVSPRGMLFPSACAFKSAQTAFVCKRDMRRSEECGQKQEIYSTGTATSCSKLRSST